MRKKTLLLLMAGWASAVLFAVTEQLPGLAPYDTTIETAFWNTKGRVPTTVCREEGTFAGALDAFARSSAEGTALFAVDAFSKFVLEAVFPDDVDTSVPGFLILLR